MMKSTNLLMTVGVFLGLMNSVSGQEHSLLQPLKLDWSAVGKTLAEEETNPTKKPKNRVSKKVELERAKKAMKSFLNSHAAVSGKSKIDGVWRSSPGIYYVFDKGRSAQFLFLDIMSDAPEGSPLVLDSTFRLTASNIEFKPGTVDSKRVPFETSRNEKSGRVLKMNLNGDKESTWREVKFD